MPLERLQLAADARFWPAAAQAVLELAHRSGLPQRRLQAITWLVPAGPHAALARGALRAALAHASFMPPRIVTLAAWLGTPLHSGTAARAELFGALRANAWVRESFGAQPAALWSLARGVAQLCDELTWAAVEGADAFDELLQASLRRHYRRRAARALQPQAQLVLQLWRARRELDDGAARALRELDTRADGAAGPLVWVANAAPAARPALSGWEERFLQRCARRAPVLVIAPSVDAALAERPLLAAAWPEMAGAEAEQPIAQRADRVREVLAGKAVPLTIVGAGSLEDEATAVAQQVLDWLDAGAASIALVALDRLTARRVRALLERARVSVRDETGWKLSTTSAAAAVMRWYDLVADDLYWRDLLDWLKSNFTLADHADKPAAVAGLERAIRAGGALQGARSIRRALSRSGTGPAADTDAAHAVLALIEAQAQTMQRAAPTLASHARALRSALDALGMRTALAADAVGAAVLDEIDALEAELAGVTGRATLAEFRALLAERFEEVSFTDRAVDSPVVLVSLAAAALRRFDAALLIGADAQHLPAAPTESLFMSGAVRAELGLASVESALREQACQLAALVASTPRVLATWRTRHGDEPNSLSPLLERLQFVAERALDDDLLRDAERDLHEVRPLVLQRPAPAAAQLLPQRISASAAQSLVNCAYQFYARRLLQLTAPDDVIEMPDKRDFGELLHEILRRFHRQWGAVGFHDIDAARLASSLSLHAHAVFDPRIEQAPGLLAFKRRFEGLIAGYVDWLQGHAAEGWRWSAAEESFAATMTLNDGRSIELGGRIDRIDAQADGRMHLLDYKARSVDALAKALQEPGEDIQLPFYGLLLAHRVQSAAYLSFDRAREDAAGVEAVAPKQDFGRLVDAVEQRLRADLQRIADGAALPAIGAPSVCRYCEMRGLCRRDYWDDSAADEMQ